MPIETFNYLDSLNPSYPGPSDGVVNGDDHIRGIKSALKITFPNIKGAITASHGELNGAAGVYTNGAALLADAGAFFKTNSTDGFKNTLAGDIDVVLQGVIAATFQRTAGTNFFKVNGAIQATGGITAAGEIKGPGITPIGAAVMWFEDTLPSDGLWCWANGGIIANANTVAPVLLARWGNRYGGNGVTTMGVPDMGGVVPVGKTQMGGVADNGLLSSISSAFKTVINAVFGADMVTLTTAQMPSHFHQASIYDPGHQHTTQTGTSTGGGGTAIFVPIAPSVTGVATTGVRVNSVNGLDTTASAGGGTAHSNLQPSKVVCWIIRLG